MKRFYPKTLAMFVATLAIALLITPTGITAHTGAGSEKLVFPNPFTSEGTTFELTMPREAKIKIDVYNIRGQHIKNLWGGESGEIHPPTQGSQTAKIKWNGKDIYGEDVPPGIYICVLQSEGLTIKSVKVIKMDG